MIMRINISERINNCIIRGNGYTLQEPPKIAQLSGGKVHSTTHHNKNTKILHTRYIDIVHVTSEEVMRPKIERRCLSVHIQTQ